MHYTVHIPPTPDRTTASAFTDAPAAEKEGEVLPERSYVSGIIFTGGLNCATRAHVLSNSAGGAWPAASVNISCKMCGCDMPALAATRHVTASS